MDKKKYLDNHNKLRENGESIFIQSLKNMAVKPFFLQPQH